MNLLRGRRKIVSSMTQTQLLDENNVVSLLKSVINTHLSNKADIDYLVDYKNGRQDVLDKVKTVRTEINHKLVINHAQMVTRTVIGYFLGNPIQYIQSGADKKEQIDQLNRFVQYEDKASVDKEIGDYQSICGTAYRIIYTDGALADELPFEDKALNPAVTFVIYENTIAEKPLCGVTYHNILKDDGAKNGVRYYVYCDFGVYTIDTDEQGEFDLTKRPAKFEPYDVGGVPIVEYPNNVWRIGDWELCIGLMEAINALHSGRLDDIDQMVQSLLVFINADIDKDKYKEMREAGIVALKNTTTNPADVKNVSEPLDQGGINLFAKELEEILYALIGIPDRNNRAGGGGDTGTAVELRDGWADLETVARNKELVFKRSEKQTLRIILKILNNTMGFDLSLLDIDIKFSRNKNNNLLVKTQSYQTLLGTKTLDPADCLTIVDLVSDVNEYIARGKTFWGEAFAGQTEALTGVEMGKANLENAKNPPEPSKKPPVSR